MTRRAIPYSPAEMAWLEANRMLVISDYHRAFVEAFGRSDVSAEHLHGFRKREGWRTGRTGRFQAGQPSPNKGKVCAPGTGGRHPNAQRTQFQKGSRTGRAAELYQRIGAERVTDDGYRMRKIHDGLPMQSRWRFVHQIEWEALNGPIPEGMALKCLSGDKSDTSPANWEPVPRGVLVRLNGGRLKKRIGFDVAPAELKPTLMAVAKLEHAAHERKKTRTA